MKTLHLYLTRQVLATLLMTVAVFTFVLLLGNVLTKEILALLVNRQASLGLVLRAVVLLLPWVLVFALPMGMLTAALLVFGRFSADQELTAVRASGVSLVAVAAPVLALSIAVSLVHAAVNLQIAPQCRQAYKDLLYRFGLEKSSSLLTEGRFITDLPGFVIYAEKIRGEQLKNVLLVQLTNNTPILRVRAAGGTFFTDRANAQLRLTLTNAQVLQRMEDRWQPGSAGVIPINVNFKSAAAGENQPRYSDMTFGELARKLEELEQLNLQNRPLGRLNAEQLRDELRKIREIKNDLTMPVRMQMHRQLAFSFACFGFTLVGVPLGIRAHRRETSIGLALAVGLVAVYYAFVVLGLALTSHAEWHPYLILWLPNFIFQALGVVLLRRANRGG